jgi:calcineurin-like phosphoesterase family protein
MQDTSKIFFTSDLHLGHANVIKYCRRPFKHATEMDEAIIARWNERIPSDGLVYVIGDVALTDTDRSVSYLQRMNGTKFLIQGNHDWRSLEDPNYVACFAWVKPFFELRIYDSDAPKGVQNITLCHYALRTWNKAHHGSWSLYGHSHGTMPELPNSKSFDVGVDTHGFYPWTYTEVKAKMATKVFRAVDHHGDI